MSECRICHTKDDFKIYIAREMMFGFREPFEYFECSKCGCLQINDVPVDLSKYYPQDYYSFKEQSGLSSESKIGLVERFRRRYLNRRNQVTRYYFNRSHLRGRVLDNIYNFGPPPESLWLGAPGTPDLKLKLNSSILDVGCGAGVLLNDLQGYGFSDLLGVDPFIDNDIDYNNGVRIAKCDIESLDRQYDFIMLHHSFEHMPQPLAVLKKLYVLLKPERYVLIRTPVAGSRAWEKYGVDWVQLDAPRHIFLHTTESLQMLAEQSGFRTASVVYDSTAFQFWGSEQYLKDIPLFSPKSFLVNPSQSIFTKQQIEQFTATADELNEKNKGDQACFYLYKI